MNGVATRPGNHRLSLVARSYRRISILTAEPAKIVAELHQEAITRLLRSLDLSDREGALPAAPGIEIARTLRILGELDLFLDFEQEPQMARNLMNLYADLRERLLPSCRQFDRRAVQETLETLAILHDGWRAVHRAGGRRV